MTTTGAPCAEAGCDGHIDDGYCDVCGHAAAAPAHRPAPSPPVPASAPSTRPPDEPPTSPTPPPGPPPASASPPHRPSSELEQMWRHGTYQSPAAGHSAVSGRGSGSTARSGSTRGQLGAGLVDVPSVPRVDPATALLVDPQVPENRRFCSHCGRKVGRRRGDRPGLSEGFCPDDQTRFSFTPKLAAGDLVGGQYDVRGCLAHGGLGWIYLATDRNVHDRWAVLKGLLNSGDDDAIHAAMAERRFLAEVDDPGIVKIHNFVQHRDRAGEVTGYIVMEYVGGSSVKQIMEQRRRPDGQLEPMPVAQALAYALKVLPALGCLHGQGLAYCDFKPDNVIHYDRQLKLIDLGAVIRFDDVESPIYGTVGYQAPEIAAMGPSPASDIYTVGRTLAVLALGMPPAQGGAPTPLPHQHPVLTRHESFHRLLLRATDPDPCARFGTTDEFADQLAGVLREVLSIEDGQPRPVVSSVFSLPRGTFAADLLGPAPSDAPRVVARSTATRGPGVSPAPGRPDARELAATLPTPLADPTDPAATQLSAAGREEVERLAAGVAHPGTELRLAVVRVALGAGEHAIASHHLDELAAAEPDDWRIDWYRGVAALFTAPQDAAAVFDRAYTTFPGETGPKLALAAAAECAGDDRRAGRYYQMVTRIEPSLADAAFGLARAALRAADRPVAISALDIVPRTSSEHVAAQLAAIDATLVGRTGTEVGPAALRAAADRLTALRLDREPAARVRVKLLTAAIDLIGPGRDPARAANGAGAGAPPILGSPWRDRDLRLALEESLRTLARLVSDHRQRVELVDQANAARPRTWT